MESKKETAKFCGNILVRKTKRRSFLAKSLFEGVFGVLTDGLFEYYHSSAQWVSLQLIAVFVKCLAYSNVLQLVVSYSVRKRKR